MKRIFLFLVLINCISFVYAKTILIGDAKIIALNWINSQGGNYFETNDIGKVYSRIENKVPIYYIVSFNPAGWIIVSGSDIAEPVLGFSTNAKFDENIMPPQFEGWMGGITREIKTAIKSKLVPSNNIRQRWQTYGDKIIEKKNLKSVQSLQAGPLLTSTWGQGRYYNEMCPTDATSTAGNGHVWVGCVATAMAQLMKYWGYPSSGMSSHSYTLSKYGNQSADFADSTYNWSAMPDNVTELNSEVQKISYHCAVSVDMNFGNTFSGAFLSSSAFINYFKYNSTVFGAEKARWDDSEWKAQLRREIDFGRPVVYSGFTSDNKSGHAWVCDGYSGDYFHFNWGWSGSYNGNFLLSALAPGSSNYSSDQAALFSIEPVYPESIPIPYGEGFESGSPNWISLMGVNEITSNQTHTGSQSLRLGKESIVSSTINAASLCFMVPSEAELNFWVKRFTPNISGFNQQKAYIMPQYGSTPLIEIYNGDYDDADWESYSVNLSAYAGQVVRLLFLQEVKDVSKQQWMYIDDISISGIKNNLSPYSPSNPIPSNLSENVSLNPTLHWSGGDPNGDDLIYNVYFGTSGNPPLVGSSFNNNYSLPELEHSTTFFWKIVANDGNLTTEGPVWSFTTKGIPPTIGNCGVSNLTSNSMTVCGEILDYNKSTVNSRGICWSQNPDPSVSDNYIEAVEPTDVYFCEITGLLPYTKYYFRAYSLSDQGDAYAQIEEVETLPEFPIVSVERVEDILRNSVSIIGKVNSVNDSSIIRRGVVWSTVPGFDPLLSHMVLEEGNWQNSEIFTINLTDLRGPGNIFFRVFAENSVGISYSNESLFTTQNHGPFIDLDLNNSSGANDSNYRGTTIEQMPGGNICDIDLEISDLDGDFIMQLTVHLINAYNNEKEFLTVLSDNENLILVGDNTNHLEITSSKALSFNEWKEVLRSIEYRNELDSPHPEIIRQIKVQVSDGLFLSNIATAFLTIVEVNDPPENQSPPKLNTSPLYGSTVSVLPGTWADMLDSCTGTFSYSFTWQMKDSDDKISELDNDGQSILLIGDNLCGSWIRVVEKVTDENCGGSNIAINQAESEWYLVGQISQTITLDPIPVHDYHESSFTLNGNTSSGLPISYNVPPDKCISISNDTAYINAVGTVVISGVQPGNECYFPSQVLYEIVNIAKSQQRIICEKSIETKYFEGWMKMQAYTTSGLELNVVSSDPSVAYVENDTIKFYKTGKVTLSISQPGNQNYFPAATVNQELTVLKGDQIITSSFENEIYYGKSSSPYHVASSSQLDVEISSSDPSILEVSDDSLLVKGAGEVIITASQPGNEFWNPAGDVIIPIIVKKGIQEIYVEVIEDSMEYGISFIPVSYSSSGLEVTFSVRDTSIAEVAGEEIVIKKIGQTFIDFSQSGNELWEPAINEIPLRVVKANQIITFSEIKTQLFGDGPIKLSAFSSSGLDIVFEISDQEVGVISGDSLYIHNAGDVEITASQPGNDQYNPAAPVSLGLSIGKANQTIVSQIPDSILFEHQSIFADVKSSSGLPLTIVSSNEEIVKVVSDSLQICGTGEVLLTLTQQGGNRNYLPAEISIEIVVFDPVNVQTLGNTHFSIFPNPTSGEVNLIVKGNLTDPVLINIVNSTGKTISNFETGNQINCLDLSNQPQGLYFIVVRYKNGNIAQKLLIAR